MTKVFVCLLETSAETHFIPLSKIIHRIQTFLMYNVYCITYYSRYIAGTLDGEPKTKVEMQKDIKTWVAKRNNTKSHHDEIDVESDFVADLCKVTGYNLDAAKSRQLFHDWEHHREENIATYRDKCFTSFFSGTKAPKPATPWFSALDDSIETFVKN